MQVKELKKILKILPNNYDVLIDGDDVAPKITIDSEFGYLLLNSKYAEELKGRNDESIWKNYVRCNEKRWIKR